MRVFIVSVEAPGAFTALAEKLPVVRGGMVALRETTPLKPSTLPTLIVKVAAVNALREIVTLPGEAEMVKSADVAEVTTSVTFAECVRLLFWVSVPLIVNG